MYSIWRKSSSHISLLVISGLQFLGRSFRLIREGLKRSPIRMTIKPRSWLLYLKSASATRSGCLFFQSCSLITDNTILLLQLPHIPSHSLLNKSNWLSFFLSKSTSSMGIPSRCKYNSSKTSLEFLNLYLCLS